MHSTKISFYLQKIKISEQNIEQCWFKLYNFLVIQTFSGKTRKTLVFEYSKIFVNYIIGSLLQKKISHSPQNQCILTPCVKTQFAALSNKHM